MGAFGEQLEREGWTIVTMNMALAIPFSFEVDHPAYKWVHENIPFDQWQVVSFKRIAFKDRGMAIMFKLTWA